MRFLIILVCVPVLATTGCSPGPSCGEDDDSAPPCDDDTDGDDDSVGDDDTAGDDDDSAGPLDEDGDGYLADEDCDDADPLIHPGAEEAACDEVDNDCNGLADDDDPACDFADLDGDGWAVAEGDCDDYEAAIYPGADEACNGIDDDCDGVVPTDELDQDGDAWSECQGDCDDTDPAANPDATEVANDGVDNDCNGYTDELTVCPQGGAMYTTLQDAVDAATPGSMLLLCEGEYDAGLIIDNIPLAIRGDTEDPRNVVLGVGGGAAVEVLGPNADIRFSWLSITAESGYYVVQGQLGAELTFDTVYFEAAGVDDALSTTGLSALLIERCYFDNLDAGWFVADSVEVRYTIFDDARVGTQDQGDAWYHHNLIVGSSGLYVRAGDTGSPSTLFENNTVVDAASWRLETYMNYCFGGGTHFPEVSFYDNIVAYVDSGYLWYVEYSESGTINVEYFAADRMDDNVFHSISTPVSLVRGSLYLACKYGSSVVYDYSLSTQIEADNLFADPLFLPDPGGKGTYALTPGSPAAGKGAFGYGADAWWELVPWEMP